MKLERLKIKNFRRIEEAELTLASSSFVIGSNNCGKTSVIDAIDALLSLKIEKVSEADFRQSADGTRAETIELEGTFSNISDETAQSRGFKGRVIDGKFTYKKTYKIASVTKPKIESITFPYNIKAEFSVAKTVKDLLDNGIEQNVISDRFANLSLSDKLPKGWEKDFTEVFEYHTDQEPVFEENTGGFPSNVNSKLPKVIRIPSLVNISDLDYKDKGSSVLSECLSLLFEDLLNQTRARGKASIISLVKYLHDLHIFPYVMHDRDQGITGAVVFNQPIADAVNDAARLILNHENVEDSLGYIAPASDKPFKAFLHTGQWVTIADIPAEWKRKFEFIFGITL